MSRREKRGRSEALETIRATPYRVIMRPKRKCKEQVLGEISSRIKGFFPIVLDKSL